MAWFKKQNPPCLVLIWCIPALCKCHCICLLQTILASLNLADLWQTCREQLWKGNEGVGYCIQNTGECLVALQLHLTRKWNEMKNADAFANSCFVISRWERMRSIQLIHWADAERLYIYTLTVLLLPPQSSCEWHCPGVFLCVSESLEPRGCKSKPRVLDAAGHVMGTVKPEVDLLVAAVVLFWVYCNFRCLHFFFKSTIKCINSVMAQSVLSFLFCSFISEGARTSTGRLIHSYKWLYSQDASQLGTVGWWVGVWVNGCSTN